MPTQFELINKFFAQQHSAFSNQTFYFRHDELTIRHFTNRIKAKLSTVFQ